MSATDKDKFIVNWMAQVVACAIRGTISCFPEERIEKMLVLMSAIMGQQIASTYVADEMSSFKLRKACRDAFANAMNKEKVLQPEAKAVDAAASIGQ